MDGLFFYWIFWFSWVYLTFILNKNNQYRLTLSAIVLLVIIFSIINFTIAGFVINAGGLCLLLISYASLYNQKTFRFLYFSICYFVVAVAYATFHLFEIFDPVWLIFNKDLMMGICIGYLVIMLQKNLKGRLMVIAGGAIQGEILYAYILNKFGLHYPIGSLTCLDGFSITSLLVASWSFIEHSELFFAGYFTAGQKNKQKTS